MVNEPAGEVTRVLLGLELMSTAICCMDNTQSNARMMKPFIGLYKLIIISARDLLFK
jgi:hypothetical protein